MEYIDIHLSQVAQMVWFGFLGKLDIAVVEVAGILEDGRLIPSSSVGNNKTWLDRADKVILEVNTWQNPRWKACTTFITAPTAARPQAHPDREGPTTGSARPICAATRDKIAGHRGDRRARPQHVLPPPDEHSRRSPAISWSSGATRSRRAGCPKTCCRCNRAWATSPTPCWRA